MNTKYKWLLGILGGLAVLYVIARATGWIQFYRHPTSAMEPNIKMKQRMLATNLKKPKRNDIIVFSRTITEKDGFDTPGKNLTFCYRLIGFGGETIQIKNGLAFIDGKLVDNKDNLKFEYKVLQKDLPLLAEILGLDLEKELENGFNRLRSLENDSYIIDLSRLDLSSLENKVQTERYVTDQATYYSDIYENDSVKRWTTTDYGPVKIPDQTFFVLGDNRLRSADSRYFGPIPNENFKGVVFRY